MTITIRNTPAYVLVSPQPKVSVRQVAAYALVKAVTPLPKGRTPQSVLAEAIKQKANEDISNVDISFSLPSVAERDPENTRVTATGYGPTVEGDKEFFYRRRPLADLAMGLNLPVIDLTGLTQAHEVLTWLIDQTGVVLGQGDILNTSLLEEDEQIVITAASNGYWFIPGSTMTLRSINGPKGTIPLNELFESTILNGFQ